MADERMIKILLSMGINEAGARRALEQFQKFQKSLADLEKEAQMVKKAISVALSAGKDTKELEQELESIEAVMLEIRRQGAGSFSRAFNEQAQAAKKTREELEKASTAQAQMTRDARDNAFHLRDIGEKLSRVGQYIGGVGSAILSPLTQASQLFLSTAAQSDPLVMRWKSEMSEIQDAWIRIGRVATQELLPLLEKAADFADRLADFVEAHPEIVRAAINAGLSMKIIGGGLETLGNLAMIAGALKGLGSGGAGGFLAKAGGAVGGFFMGTGGAVLGGVGAGVAGYNAIAEARGLQSAGEIAKKSIAILTYGFYKAGFASLDAVKGVFAWANGVQRSGQAASSAASAISNYATAIELGRRYSVEKANIESSYQSKIQSLYRQHSAAMSQISSQLSSALAAIEASYQASQLQAQEQFQQQYASIVQQGQEQIRQIIADSQERLRQMEMDHAQRVEELTNARDALGLAQENRRHQQEVAEEKRRAAEAIRQAKQQTQMQLQQLQQQFALEQAERERQYELEKQQAQQAASDQMAAEQQNYALQLAELQAAKQEELRQLQWGYAEQLRQLGYRFQGERNLAAQWHAAMLADVNSFWQSYAAQMQAGLSSLPGPEGRASGGYAASGLYRLGEHGREFVLSAETTRAAENLLGGALTQRRILGGMTGNSKTVYLHQDIRFNGGAAPDRAQIRTFMRQVAEQTFAEALNGAI